MSGTHHILAPHIMMPATALHRFTSLKIFLCSGRVYKLTMFLDAVDSDTTNQKSTLTRTKPSVLTRTKLLFHTAWVTLLPRLYNSPQALLTPLSRHSHAVMTPLTSVPRPSHAAVTRLPHCQQCRCSRAVLTPLSLSNDAPLTQW